VALSKWPDVKDKLVQVGAWCRDGLTEKSICHNLGISEQTFNIYKHEHPELCEALKKGKAVADNAVVSSLYRRCLGFEYDELTYDATGKVVKKVTKLIPPDSVSCFFWLKNRLPAQWRDHREVEKTIELKAPVLAEVMQTFKDMRLLNKVSVIDAIGSDDVKKSGEEN
jgi:hypothetical protein